MKAVGGVFLPKGLLTLMTPLLTHLMNHEFLLCSIGFSTFDPFDPYFSDKNFKSEKTGFVPHQESGLLSNLLSQAK